MAATPFSLTPIPYSENALEPIISAQTVGFHYGKHHSAYVAKLNKLVEGTEFAEAKLEDVVRNTAGSGNAVEKKIFNNAAQVWNHDCYWRSLSPDKTEPNRSLRTAIERDFGSMEALIAKFALSGREQFGSGWVWLVSKRGSLSVEKTGNAMNPMALGTNCLLGIDVWEHAYYLDYQNDRPRYLESVLERLLNWDYASENFEQGDSATRAAAE